MSQSKSAAKSVFIIIIFSLISKSFGFIREMLIAHKFGAGIETDTYFVALAAINLFISVIIQSINTTMIPILSKVEVAEGKEGKNHYTNNLLNIILLISLFMIVIAGIFSPQIIKMLASGFEGQQFKLAVLMMRIGLPAIFFAGMQGVYRGYLQNELLFTESALADLPLNFIYIFYLVFLSGFFGIKGLMVTFVVATASKIIMQIPGMKKSGYSYKFILDFKDKYVKKIVYLIPPVLISVGVGDINKIIDKSLASKLADGSISALTYATRLDDITSSVFIMAITTVIFPVLSREANKETYEGLKKVIIYGINIVLLITIPATVGMIILANPIVKVAFERGAFDSAATHMTVGALVFYTVGLVATSIKAILNRVYYSLQDTKTPMYNSFIAVAVNVAFNFILISSMAHKGLALATSISAIVTSILLLYGLKRKIGSFGLICSIRCGLKSLLASLVMGVSVYFIDKGLIEYLNGNTIKEMFALIITIAVGGLIYLVLIYLLGVKEMECLVNTIKKKIKT